MTQPTHTPAIKLGNSADWFNDNVQKHIDQIPQPYKATYDAAPELLSVLLATQQFIGNLPDNVMDKALALKHIDEAIAKARG